MTSYLLLRDNKESGPYSFDDLKLKGLKAYDLIWVNGKSAAWRYPSEIDEFKAFAPVVEEQPFDRFFKRPSQVAATAGVQSGTGSYQQTTATGFPDKAATPAPGTLTGEPSSIPGKRIIYVTLPAGRSVPTMRAVHPALSNDIRFQPPVTQPAVQQPVQPAITEAVQTETGRRNDLSTIHVVPQRPNREHAITDPSLEENFAQENVEIKPRSRNSIAKRILQPVAAGVVVLVLVAAGVFIGLSINKDSLGFLRKIGINGSAVTQQPVSASAQEAQPVVEPTRVLTNQRSAVDQPNVSPVSQSQPSDPNIQPVHTSTAATTQPSLPPSNTSTVAPATGNPITPPAHTIASIQPTDKKPAAVPATVPPVGKKKGATTKDGPVAAIQKTTSPSGVRDSGYSLLPMVNRQAVHRTDGTSPDKDVVKSNIANLVSVSNNTYNVGTFGGISDLQVTVSNRSIYPLDLVVVEVEYVQANKKIYKTEDMYFRGIGPGSALMQQAAKSPRGVKVQYKITLINSKDLNLSFSAL